MNLSKGEIRKQAIETLEKRGCNVWPQNNLAVPGRKFIGRKGVPDIIGYTKAGLYVGCEVKAKGDTLSKEQLDFLIDLKKCGGIALLAIEDPVGMVDLIDIL